MKSLFESLLITLSMYSILPVHAPNWNEKNLRNAFVFFPFVGLLCGGVLWLIWIACEFLQIGAALFGVVGVVASVAITGGIHLDGFCDTTDALCSRRTREEKLRILKDPNCGPFAVFWVVLVLLLQFGAYVQLYSTQSRRILGLLLGGFVLSRCLSGLSVAAFPSAPTSSLGKTFGNAAGKHVIVILLLEFVLTEVLLVFFYHWFALLLTQLVLLVFFWFQKMQKKQFGGMTGDLAGFFLIVAETTWLLFAALLGGVFCCG